MLPRFGHLRLRLLGAGAALLMLVSVVPGTVAAAPGDEPSTAITATVGTARYDSTNMTESGADPAACPDSEFGGPFTNTMWFSYRPARDALTQVDVNSFVSDGSTDFLAILFVYAQTSGGLDLIACSAYPATVLIPAEAGTTYLIMVAGLSASDVDDDPTLLDHGGTFDLTITPIRGRILVDHFHDSDTFVDDGLTEACGDGDVTVSFDDHATAKTFFDSSGPRAFTFQISGWTTFQMGDGPIVKVSYHQTFHDYFDGTISNIGIPIKITIDGQLLMLDAGTVVFDGETGEILFEAGPHPELHEGFDLCAALAG